MPCENCNGTNLEYVHEINLHECEDCGLLAVSRILTIREQSQKITPEERGFAPLDIVLNEFNLREYRISIIKNYNTLKAALVFNRVDEGTTFAAVTYYTLSQTNAEYNIHKICSFMGVNKNKMFKINKRIKQHYHKVGVLGKEKYRIGMPDITELSEEGKLFLDSLGTNYTITRSIMAAILYEYSDLTQAQVCEKLGVSLPRLKRHLTVIRNGEER
jgi:transcription initiation factor TFIIIB Brf1 subunit/transcription initiation factor TFIIB